MPTFGSLFAGIGGIDLGLERAGWECRWQVEIDDFCRKVLTKHWPDVPKYSDIKEIDGHELQAVDLIAGGFPCQPVSLAGKRKAQEDERWLWHEFARIIGRVRPRMVLAENVPGLRSKGFGDVLRDLARLGYDAEWACIPAAAFGAPHLRYRLFIVAYARSIEYEGAGDEDQRQTAARLPQTVVADALGVGSELRQAEGRRQGGFTGSGGAVPDADEGGCLGRSGKFREAGRGEPSDCGRWAVEPAVGRVAYGVPGRVDRLKGLGNAVVPQVAEWIGRRLLEHKA
jgi:DNA (cytosine-5)-methyltransferase 1